MKLCAYYTCGFPDLESSVKILDVISEIADYVEVGIPFSDPIADGPVIQYANDIALKNGFKVEKTFSVIQKLSEKFPDKRFIIMTYYNIVFQGGDRFLEKAKQAGVWGLAIPDLPPGEDENFEKKLKEEDIKTIFFVAPTTPKKRVKYITQKTTGFIYYINVKGVTGEREKLPDDLKQNIIQVRKIAKKDVFAGFGISNTSQVKELKGIADGIIIGSAIIKRVIDSSDTNEAVRKIKTFLEEVKNAI